MKNIYFIRHGEGYHNYRVFFNNCEALINLLILL